MCDNTSDTDNIQYRRAGNIQTGYIRASALRLPKMSGTLRPHQEQTYMEARQCGTCAGAEMVFVLAEIHRGSIIERPAEYVCLQCDDSLIVRHRRILNAKLTDAMKIMDI